MNEIDEKKNNRGGARAGSGRKKTGLMTKNYTIHLPLDIAEEMEKRAAQLGKTVNRYLRDIIEASGQYGNVSIEGKQVDDGFSSNVKTGMNIDLGEKKSVKDLINSQDQSDESKYQLDDSYQMAAEEDSAWYKVDSKSKGGKK